MEKAVIPITILLLIIAVAIALLSLNIIQAGITSNVISETHSYTKAVCSSTNYCQDYIVRCNGDHMISMNPITGAAVQFSTDWQDPRDPETINDFC